MTPNHEQTDSEKTRRDAAERERSEILQAIRQSFGGDAGGIVLRWLKHSAGYGKPSFLPPPAGGPLDPLAAAFRDGRKSIIDEIIDALAVAEDGKPPEPPKSIR